MIQKKFFWPSSWFKLVCETEIWITFYHVPTWEKYLKYVVYDKNFSRIFKTYNHVPTYNKIFMAEAYDIKICQI